MTFVTDQGIDLQLLGSAADEARQVCPLTAAHHNTPSAAHRQTTHNTQTHIVPRGQSGMRGAHTHACAHPPTHHTALHALHATLH